MDIAEADYPLDELGKYVRKQPVLKQRSGKGSGTGSKVKIINSHSSQHHKIRRHISERRWTFYNWYRHLHWRNITLILLIPLLGLLYSFAYDVPLQTTTLKFAILNYVVTCLSINIGYHRYYSHRSFTIRSKWLNLLLLVNGASGGVGNAKWWSCAHRAHHRYCDTERDPHNSRKGLIYSHMGWMVLRHHPKVQHLIKESEYDELNEDSILSWQYENYFKIFILCGLLVPSAICGWFWDDYLGGLIYAGVFKTIYVQQTFFLVNSLCHSKYCCGTQPFDDRKSSRNNFLLHLLTFGEGNHNFHHEFPSDYRNGIHWYSFDPCKWCVYLLNCLGLVSDLKKTPLSLINQLLIQHQQTLIDRKRAKLNWGIAIDRLPKLTAAEFQNLVKTNPRRALVVVSGIVHDVTSFVEDHPGGVALIKTSIGKDATSAFNGAVYDHSNAAHNLLATMRILVIKGINSEQLVWKQQQIENKEVPLKQDTEGKKIVRSGEQVTNVKLHPTTAGAA